MNQVNYKVNLIHTSKLLEVMKTQSPEFHCYADDTCWKVSNTGQMNWIIIPTEWRQEWTFVGHHNSSEKWIFLSLLKVTRTEPMPIARNRGVWLDSRLSMTAHITMTCSSSSFYIYNICCIWIWLSQQPTEDHLHAFITSRIVYCRNLLYRLIQEESAASTVWMR